MKRIISLNETLSTAKKKQNEHNLHGQITKHKNQEKSLFDPVKIKPSLFGLLQL